MTQLVHKILDKTICEFIDFIEMLFFMILPFAVPFFIMYASTL